MFGIGEFLAEQVKDISESPVYTFHEQDGMHVTYPSRVPLAVRSFSLPNYWVWYHGNDVIQAIEAQAPNVSAMLYVTIFNACVNTGTIYVLNVFVMMFLLFRTMSRQRRLFRLLWLLPTVAFVCDLVEDILLLVVILGYPMHQYPPFLTVLPYCSAGKFSFWVLSLVVDGWSLFRWASSGFCSLEEFTKEHKQKE